MKWNHLLCLLTIILLIVKLFKTNKSIGLDQRSGQAKPRPQPKLTPSNSYPPVVAATSPESSRPTVERVHFPRTTAGQRQLLFERWQASGNVSQACRKAHVSRGTFYKWLPRFEKEGYEALQQFACPAPKHPLRTSTQIEQQVINLRREHSDWGKQKIANELARRNNWVPVVSPNTVRRILQEAGLWDQASPASTPKGPSGIVRTAEIPGQSLNIDLCFVPASHEIEARLPAVSGSSGRLVIKHPPAETSGPVQYPGRIFEDESLSYETAMQGFVAASQTHSSPETDETGFDLSTAAAVKAEKRAIRQEEEILRIERRQVRQQRQSEDAAWRAFRQQRQNQQAALSNPQPVLSLCQTSTSETTSASIPSDPNQTGQADQFFITDQQWQQQQSQRRQQLKRRQQQDHQWRQKRHSIRERLATLPLITSWFAILVIIDNCTRQCLGLPLFVVGSHVTAEMIVEALCQLLPPDLMFLITDRGIHFRAKVFQQLAKDENFLHVLIARHRPQSNGIAERFVRTLKEWLANKSWSTEDELLVLLAQFQAEYNDCPHQGLAIPGLSPNEFAGRIWLL